MPARAQKRKRAAGGDEKTSARQKRAAQPPAAATAEAAADAAADRAAPDPQQPPVVAPVLMPAVGLEVREDAPSALAAATAVDAEAIAPVAEAIMSVTARPRPATDEQGAALPYGQRGDKLPAIARQTADQNGDGSDVDVSAWRAPDEARLLVQSPRRLFLYWRFARDPRELLREALGPVAERYTPAVRLVDAASGNEGEPLSAEGSDYWFDVLPGRLLRAEVGFHGDNLPFVRLISSNTVETPAVGVSRAEDEAPEFRVAGHEFGRVLEATGFAAGERREERARRGARGEDDDHDPSFAPTRTDDPLRARASSDTARPTSSPRHGGHFSGARGGELF